MLRRENSNNKSALHLLPKVAEEKPTLSQEKPKASQEKPRVSARPKEEVPAKKEEGKKTFVKKVSFDVSLNDCNYKE